MYLHELGAHCCCCTWPGGVGEELEPESIAVGGAAADIVGVIVVGVGDPELQASAQVKGKTGTNISGWLLWPTVCSFLALHASMAAPDALTAHLIMMVRAPILTQAGVVSVLSSASDGRVRIARLPSIQLFCSMPSSRK